MTNLKAALVERQQWLIQRLDADLPGIKKQADEYDPLARYATLARVNPKFLLEVCEIARAALQEAEPAAAEPETAEQAVERIGREMDEKIRQLNDGDLSDVDPELLIHAQAALYRLSLVKPAAVEPRPAAWIRTHVTPDTPMGSAEYDVECAPGDEQPPGSGWAPLYARPAAAEGQAGQLAALQAEVERIRPLAERYECIRQAGSSIKLYVYDDEDEDDATLSPGDWLYKPKPEDVDAFADAALLARKGE